MKTGQNIRQRKDGRYEARYIKARDENGKILYGYCYGKTYDEALAKKNEMIFALGHETTSPNANSFQTTLKMREMNLLILGAGEHGQEVKELAESLRVFNKIGFLDDDQTKNVLGPCKNFSKYLYEYSIAIPAVGNDEVRKKWMEGLANAGYVIPTLVHPSAVVSGNAKVGTGTVICAGATVGIGANIGVGCIIDSGAVVEKKASVPDWTWVSCGEVFKG